MVGPELLRRALLSGEFPNVSARRLRNIVQEAFAPRYLVDEAQPAKLLKAVVKVLPPADFRQLLFLYTCRANPILADFMREVYWPRYEAGARAIDREEAGSFVIRAVHRGRTVKPWSASTVVRVSNYLLGACTDYGFLGPVRSGARAIVPFRIAQPTVTILAHESIAATGSSSCTETTRTRK